MIEIRALRENERDACIDLWRTVWPGDNDAYFRRYFEGDVEWLPYYTQVAMEDGKLVSAVHICKRTVACGDFRLQMGGIANVATLPGYRGRGLNTACLRSAIAIMEADALDFSLLFTGINGYYAREGFSNLKRVRLRGILAKERALPANRLLVRPALPQDLDQIFEVYNSYNAVRPIAVQRSPGYWRDWIGLTAQRLGGSHPPLVAVDESGRVVGYIIYHLNFYPGHQVTEDYAYVSEYGALTRPDGSISMSAEKDDSTSGITASDSIATALLGGVAERALSSGKRELHLSIALDASIRNAMSQLCEATAENVTESCMARLLHRENLLRSFLMEWNDRWTSGGRPGGEALFSTPYGPVRLNANGPFLAVSSVDNPSDSREPLDQSTLLGLLFGAVRPEHLAVQPEQSALLKSLFPPQDGVYWSADGF